MKFSVIINNYNYGRYLQEAIDSVLAQTHTDFELIIVDDGSTDTESHAVLDAIDDPRIRVIRKHNGGQLSCFNAAWPASRGDIVTFLDADDRYKPHHLATIAQAACEQPNVDFFATSMAYFGKSDSIKHCVVEDTIFSLTSVRTWYFKRWYGQPTSALAIRQSRLAQFMPLPLDADWLQGADACLVHACSLLGAGKMFLREVTVDYRHHDNNYSHTRMNSLQVRAQYKQTRYKLFRWLLHSQGLTEQDLKELARWEFAAIERWQWQEYRDIARLVTRIGPLSALRILNTSWLPRKHKRNQKKQA